jgi:hypothetical protein
MKKAFDWVDRDLLMYKLLTQYSLTGKLYNAIKSIYSHSSGRVRINDQYTEQFNITSGVKQGDNLSPTLFNMFINDLAAEVKALNCGVNVDGHNICILLYADDIALIAPDERKLQCILDHVALWCKKWRMIISNDKSEIVHFRPTRVPQTHSNFTFNDLVIRIVSVYKYLGIHLDEHLSFKDASSNLSAAASRALGYLRFKLKYLKECRYATFTKLYTSCVCPILDYSSGVWGIKSYSDIEKVQHNALRYFLGVHKFAPIDMLVGDTGWLSTFSRHKLSILRLWNRLYSLPEDSIAKIIFGWDIAYSNKPDTWSSHVQQILEDIGSLHTPETMDFCDIALAYDIIRQQEIDAWNDRRYNKPKLRYYNMFKIDYSHEEYLNMNIPKYQRSIFAQFRAGILPLQVEIGRFRNIDLPERLCTLCDSGEVEDEYHLLCVCVRYANIRVTLFNQAYEMCATFNDLHELDKFVYLINNLQREVITFLTQAISIRRQSIYSSF